jgi:hypothetical protein
VELVESEAKKLRGEASMTMAGVSSIFNFHFGPRLLLPRRCTMKVLIALLSSLSMASAFTASARLTAASTRAGNDLPRSTKSPVQIQYINPLNMSSNGSKKRRKRKDGKQFAPPTAEPITAKAVEVQASVAPKENTVVMQVQDIRNVVAGVDPTATQEDDDELGPDEEWEYYDEDEEEETMPVRNGNPGGRMQDDSMEQLLADARKMRSASKAVEEKEKTATDTVFEIISTIVTIDFFVVVALLVWFLAGIFCSSVLKDDTVQIAFNMNFERVTQPALGILMIGSVAGSLGKKENEED